MLFDIRFNKELVHLKSRFFAVGIVTALLVSTSLPTHAAKKKVKAFNGKVCTIVGSTKSETLKGTSKSDVICGLGGNDIIKSFGGDDVVDGGTGSDFIYGSTGKDTINGGYGNDTISGGSGNDSLYGASGNDIMLGDDGVDRFYPGSGINTCELSEELVRPNECQLLRDFSGLLHRVTGSFTGMEFRNCWVTLYYADSVPPEWQAIRTFQTMDSGYRPAAVGYVDSNGTTVFDVPAGQFKGMVGINDLVISSIRATENKNFNTVSGCQWRTFKNLANEKRLTFSLTVDGDEALGSIDTPQLVNRSITVKTSSGQVVSGASIEGAGYYSSDGVPIAGFGSAYNFVGAHISLKTNAAGVWSTDAYPSQLLRIRATKVISGITFRTPWHQFDGANSESAELVFQ